jgi:uncharacterized membrane protein
LPNWQTALDRWRTAGLIDADTAGRVRDWELEHGEADRHDRLARLAFGLGGLLLAAGVLLFVAAHWEELSPAWRFTLVLLMVGGLHGAAVAVQPHSASLATTLHAVGTAALGAGIFLAGQIFNMAEHWPGALMLWALGAAAALALLRDWPQALWVAVLAPGWLFGEWVALHEPLRSWNNAPALGGCLLLALVYLAARAPRPESAWRGVLTRLGAAALLPLAVWYGFEVNDRTPDSSPWMALGWAVALALPAALAVFLRGRDAVFLLPAAVIVVLLAFLPYDRSAGEFIMFVLFALLSVGLVLWGLRDQDRFTVNLGVTGFALTLLFFYFASLFDKLGRSLGLIGMGVVFIGGGWLLERMRRRLLGRIGQREGQGRT